MLFMVTNRRVENGRYSDEEKPNNKFEYQYSYNNKPIKKDGFNKAGKKGFETALLGELERLKKSGSGEVWARRGTEVETPVGKFPAYMDEESILLGKHLPPLNRSHHR